MLAALMEVAERLPDTVSAVGVAAAEAGSPVPAAGESGPEPAAVGDPDDRGESTTGSGPLPPLPHSAWWNLDSQWRLAGLLGLLLVTLIGMNWGILALFRGPFARLASESGEPAAGLPKDLGPLALVGAAIGGAAPPAVIGPARESRGPSICAMSYAEPARIARVLEERAGLKQDDGGARTIPTARLRVELRHRLSAGRIVVLLDGRTVLSKPFDASRNKGGSLSHLLTVPAGRHGVEVRLTSAKGAIEGKAKISGTLGENTLTVLKGELPKGKGGRLTLAWAGIKDQTAVRSEQ
jgi:hypothetical protein